MTSGQQIDEIISRAEAGTTTLRDVLVMIELLQNEIDFMEHIADNLEPINTSAVIRVDGNLAFRFPDTEKMAAFVAGVCNYD